MSPHSEGNLKDEQLPAHFELNWDTSNVEVGDRIGSVRVETSGGVDDWYDAIWTGNGTFKLELKETK